MKKYRDITISDKKGLNQWSFKTLQFQKFYTGENGGRSEVQYIVISSSDELWPREIEKIANDFHIVAGSFQNQHKIPEVFEFEGYQGKKYYEYVFKYHPSTE